MLGPSPSSLSCPQSIPNITPDLEQVIAILYGDGGEGASLHREPDPKQAKESPHSHIAPTSARMGTPPHCTEADLPVPSLCASAAV